MKPATPGTVLTAIATVLLALASFNVPLLKQIYYFKASFSSSAYTGTLTLGTLGYCLVKDGVTTCSSPSVGYELGKSRKGRLDSFGVELTLFPSFPSLQISTQSSESPSSTSQKLSPNGSPTFSSLTSSVRPE